MKHVRDEKVDTKRRRMLFGVVAGGAAGLLQACGGGSATTAEADETALLARGGVKGSTNANTGGTTPTTPTTPTEPAPGTTTSDGTMPAGYVSVLAYGAKGDGVSDDSIAVQDAMNANVAVWFPAGTYLVGDLKLKDKQQIAGTGAGSRLLQKVGSQFCVSANPHKEGYADPALNLSGLGIRNLNFEGQSGNVTFSEWIYLLNLNGVSDVTVSGCKFVKYVGDGIYLGSSNNLYVERHNYRVTISNCQFDGVTKGNRNGISIIDGTDITIDSCSFTRSGRTDQPGAIDIEPNPQSNAFVRIQRITISNCTFSDLGSRCFISVVLSPNDVLAHPADTIKVINCSGTQSSAGFPERVLLLQQFDGSVNSATATTPPLNFVMSGCNFENINRPFIIYGVRGVRIENSTFKNAGYYAYLGAPDNTCRNRDVVIKGCSFTRIGTNPSGREGLVVFGNDYVTVESCLFEDCGAADGSGGHAMYFGGTARSSYVNLRYNTFTSALRRTSKAIGVASTHVLDVATNTQVGTVLSGVTGNMFLPA
ncbi:MAG: hypothetical protein JWP36_977 [Paucimonas sp.]|nr:hypothetical protein [Paucimonas sp.]